jgi:hypothetical protein
VYPLYPFSCTREEREKMKSRESRTEKKIQKERRRKVERRREGVREGLSLSLLASYPMHKFFVFLVYVSLTFYRLNSLYIENSQFSNSSSILPLLPPLSPTLSHTLSHSSMYI